MPTVILTEAAAFEVKDMLKNKTCICEISLLAIIKI